MRFLVHDGPAQNQVTPELDYVVPKKNLYPLQGSKKVSSCCPGEVDFPVGQVTFHSHLPNGQGPRQVICQLNRKKSNLRLAQGKQNLRATCPKGKLEFKFFSSPAPHGSSLEIACGREGSLKATVLGPVYMVSGTRDNPPPELPWLS